MRVSEYQRQLIDFNKALRPYPAKEFEFKISGSYMEYLHIQDGDTVIVDRSKKPMDGCVAILIFENEYICRQIWFSKKWNCFVFKNYTRWERVTDIFGIVNYCIHAFAGKKL